MIVVDVPAVGESSSPWLSFSVTLVDGTAVGGSSLSVTRVDGPAVGCASPGQPLPQNRHR